MQQQATELGETAAITSTFALKEEGNKDEDVKDITNKHLDRGEEAVDLGEAVLHLAQRVGGGVRSPSVVQHVARVGHPERKRSQRNPNRG